MRAHSTLDDDDDDGGGGGGASVDTRRASFVLCLRLVVRGGHG